METFFLAVVAGTHLSFFIMIALVWTVTNAGIYSLAKKENMKNAWLVFVPIPIFSVYFLGELIKHKLGKFAGVKFLLAWTGIAYLGTIQSVEMYSSLLAIGVGLVAVKWLYEKYSEKSMFMTLITFATLGLAFPALMLYLANKEDFESMVPAME